MRACLSISTLICCLASSALLSTALADDRTKTLRRLAIGDLVRFVDGAGLDLAEVLGGPDPSNYYVLTGSNGKPIAVPREKLRLVQSAGAKRAAFNAGDVVDWKLHERSTQRGVVIRVNGAWCEVKSMETDSNWVECKALRRTKGGAGAPAERAKSTPAPT
jgi:hypothetical protein